MAPLIILCSTFLLLLPLYARVPLARRGRWALAVMFVVTGTSHFTSTESLAAMVPPPLPWPIAIVYATGALELALAFWLVRVRGPSRALGWVLVTFLMLVLPANVYSAVSGVGMGGHGPTYLLFRVPAQLLYIVWSGLCTGLIPSPRLAE